jgi:hypothetical protein
MITLTFRIALLIAGLLAIYIVARSVRENDLSINQALFWVVMAIILFITGIFPQYIILVAHLLGVYSTSNVFFLIIIFILAIRLYFSSIAMSKMENKVEKVVQELALKELENEQHSR